MNAQTIFAAQDYRITSDYYAALTSKGTPGKLAAVLIYIKRQSWNAKHSVGGDYRMKQAGIAELCRLLRTEPHGCNWGWKRDGKRGRFRWVLYVDLPTGQVSFHSDVRFDGPDYHGEWDARNDSMGRIFTFCNKVASA